MKTLNRSSWPNSRFWFCLASANIWDLGHLALVWLNVSSPKPSNFCCQTGSSQCCWNRNVAGKCSQSFLICVSLMKTYRKRFGRDCLSRAWIVTQNIFYLQTIKHTGTAVRRIFHIDGNIKSPKADAQVDKESRQHVLTSSDFNGVSEIKRESDFDAKTKIVGIKFQFANWLALYPI